ncbi:MAG: alpha/beta fold hydrolase [Aquificaceae bacterium]|uniref:alpha/beta fold hydrolase n=1 Tax=Hydrogenobacter sp. Uz 6-8 TaxID=3384828 RepID=UPI00309C60AE
MPSVDLPYHGKSQLSYSDLWSLARSLALKAESGSVLIGWSMGASLALMMAYLFPEKFRGLLLIGASPCFGCAWSEKNLRAFLLRLEREREGFLREFRSLAYPKGFEDTVDIEGAKRILREYMYTDLRHILPYIRQRVLILHGEKDTIVPLSSALTLYNMLKRSKLITFPGGHFPEYENLIFEVLKGLQ